MMQMLNVNLTRTYVKHLVFQSMAWTTLLWIHMILMLEPLNIMTVMVKYIQLIWTLMTWTLDYFHQMNYGTKEQIQQFLTGDMIMKVIFYLVNQHMRIFSTKKTMKEYLLEILELMNQFTWLVISRISSHSRI